MDILAARKKAAERAKAAQAAEQKGQEEPAPAMPPVPDTTFVPDEPVSDALLMPDVAGTPGEPEEEATTAATAAGPGPGSAPAPAPANATKASPGGTGTNDLPVVPPVWTLVLNAAKIPAGRVNGKIAGTNFIAQTARVDYAGATPVLSLRQGTGPSPDREILVYLRLKPGEQLGSNSWSVTKEMKGPSVPQVSKRWKTNPKYAPTQKAFSTGYAMKLELGPLNEGEISGKIFVALPDPEQTVVAGIFTAAATVPVAGAPPVVNPTPTPTAPPRSNPEFEARYGIKR